MEDVDFEDADWVSLDTGPRTNAELDALERRLLVFADPHAGAVSVVDPLRQNDPARTEFSILLRAEISDAALAQALEQNPFVTDITLHLDGVPRRTDWDSLLRVIAMRSNLEKVTLKDADDPDERTAPVGLKQAILRAIQQNTSVRKVYFCRLHLPADTLSTFLDSASSITLLSFWKCDMGPAQGVQEARDLAAALQRNTNIQTLQLGYLLDFYSIPILEGLRSNASIKTLIFFATDFSDAASHAIQHLLESTPSIQRFELQGFQQEDFWGRLLRPIAQGIRNSESVSELKLSECQFRDDESNAQLKGILQNKRNLTSLCLHDCHFDMQVHGAIISVLVRPGSLLRCFEFHGSLGSMRNPQFFEMVSALQISKLERLSIGTIQSQEQLQMFSPMIPGMKLKELEIVFASSFTEALKQNLLQTVKNNLTLLSVKGKLHSNGADFFDSAEDRQRLALYANRNKTLDQWVDHPEIVEQQGVWPEALTLAERVGPSALFRGLRSVLERDYVKLPGGKKRKRTQDSQQS